MAAEGNIKTVNPNALVIADNYPASRTFRAGDGSIGAIRDPYWRTEPDGSLREGDVVYHRFSHPREYTPASAIRAARETVYVAKRQLLRLRKRDLSGFGMGIELEGDFYDPTGKKLLSRYKGTGLTADTDPHPETFDALHEVATGLTPDGRLPSSPIEIAHALADAVLGGIATARKRNGLYVIASVPEGADISEIRVTQHPYIIRMAASVAPFHETPGVPQEALDIYDRVGIQRVLPIQALHVTTDNPETPNGEAIDSKIAFVKGRLKQTLIEKLINFSLYNTRDYLGVHLPDISDGRAIARRGWEGTHDTTVPATVYDFLNEAANAVERGEIHSVSRHPKTGQHGVMRIKEHGGTEGIDGAANPDLRLDLNKAFTDQMMTVFAYEALIETEGDESQALPYLQKKYGNLFQIIPALKGEHSSFQLDLEFNRNRFEGRVFGATFAQYLKQFRGLIRKIGNDFPVFETQAKIVNHVLGKVVQPRQQDIDLSNYLGWESGIRTGIITDYKSPDITENIQAQAEGTEAQALALAQVRDENDLLAFFGLLPKTADVFRRK